MHLWDTIFLWIGRLTALFALFALFRHAFCNYCAKPMINFSSPEYKEDSFGLTWYISISNTNPKGLIGKICGKQDVAKCRVRGEFKIEGDTRIHEWGTDPAMPIVLPANSEPSEIDLVNKKQGYEWCQIDTVAEGDSERLPRNSTILVELSVLEGSKTIGAAKYRIENYGIDMSGLKVSRAD